MASQFSNIHHQENVSNQIWKPFKFIFLKQTRKLRSLWKMSFELFLQLFLINFEWQKRLRILFCQSLLFVEPHRRNKGECEKILGFIIRLLKLFAIVAWIQWFTNDKWNKCLQWRGVIEIPRIFSDQHINNIIIHCSSAFQVLILVNSLNGTAICSEIELFFGKIWRENKMYRNENDKVRRIKKTKFGQCCIKITFYNCMPYSIQR